MEIAKDNLKKSWHWLNWQNWIGREQNKHVTTKTAYQSGLKGRGRLRKLHRIKVKVPYPTNVIRPNMFTHTHNATHKHMYVCMYVGMYVCR